MRGVWLILTAFVGLTRLWGGEVNGTWTAEAPDQRGSIIALRMKFNEEDGILTGSIRGSQGEQAISNGFVDGDSITFCVVTEFHGEQIEQRYRGTVEGDVIHFSVAVEEGRAGKRRVSEFDAARTDAEATDE